MKKVIAKEHTVLQEKPAKRCLDTEKCTTSPKGEKRDNIVSRSSDTREDRAEHQMKTAQNPQTLPQ